MITAMRELVQSGISGFALAAKGRRRKINTTASLSDAFFEAIAAACAVHSELAAAGGVSASDLRNTIARSRVRASVAEELRILARGVDDTDAEDRHQAGQRALRVYHVADRINRPEDREMLIPHLAAMKRTLNRGRSAAKRSAAAKAAAAATATAKAAEKAAENATVPVTSGLAPAVTTPVAMTPVSTSPSTPKTGDRP
jgi:dsRNA-specific ribonuclease